MIVRLVMASLNKDGYQRQSLNGRSQQYALRRIVDTFMPSMFKMITTNKLKQ